jgi:primosomal protein N'
MNHVAVANFYNTLPSDRIAENTPENNINNGYYWMKNKYGRIVPVQGRIVMDALQRGYTHTDNQLVADDLSKDVRKNKKRKPSEKQQLANALTQLSKALPHAEVSDKQQDDNVVVSADDNVVGVRPTATPTMVEQFNELKEIGWLNLNKEQRAAYSELKKILDGEE